MNEDYFSVIDTEEKTYYLGLILTDGNIHKIKNRNNSYRLQISLNSRDINILINLLNELESNRTLSSKRNEIIFSINSKKICQDLMYYGIFERKSNITRLTFNIPKCLYRHFIRGIFDGDGICSAGKQFYFGFCGASKYLICEIQTFLINEINIKKNLVYKNHKVFYFSNSSRKDIQKFYDYLYTDSKIYLDRKKAKFEHYLNSNKKIPR